MELIERATYLDILQYRYEDAKKGMGNGVLLTGEAGMGKTSLVRAFSHRVHSGATVLTGTCDSLFTPYQKTLILIEPIIWGAYKVLCPSTLSLSCQEQKKVREEQIILSNAE